MMYWKTY